MREEMNIQWFPGHMTKARRMITENMKLIDAVCEITDARIPASSRNPDVDELTGGKPRLMVLNRVDQADPEVTRRWGAYFKARGMAVIETDCKSGKGVAGFPNAVRTLLREKLARDVARGLVGRRLRVMVVGIPNVGKSTFINKVAKRRAAESSDRPGVTRGKQWITVDNGLELLDTPGILWPRFDSRTVGENLAFTGAVKDEILDRETLGGNLLLRLCEYYPGRIAERYKIETETDAGGIELLTRVAKRRGFLLPGGEYDLERCAAMALDEFRGGKLGRVSLEPPPGGET
jgi:ribosome biogenesis GTPase A